MSLFMDVKTMEILGDTILRVVFRLPDDCYYSKDVTLNEAMSKYDVNEYITIYITCPTNETFEEFAVHIPASRGNAVRQMIADCKNRLSANNAQFTSLYTFCSLRCEDAPNLIIIMFATPEEMNEIDSSLSPVEDL